MRVGVPGTQGKAHRDKGGLNMTIKVNNAPEIKAPYVVVRRAEDSSLWYYGQYKDKETATQVAVDIGNGFVAEGLNG